MEAQIFIIEKLNSLISVFNNVTFKYKFDYNSLTHIIEVQPLEIYEKNIEYIDCEANFIYEFEEKFSSETILFVSDNSLTKVENADFIIKNNKYAGILHDNVLNNFNYCGCKEVFDENFDYALAA